MFRRTACTWLGVAVLVSATTFGCSLDERQLGASAGAPGAGAGTGAGGNTSDGAAGSDEPAPLPVCDYGSEVPVDCDSLVQNPGFSKDVSGWIPEQPSVVMSWAPNDAQAHKNSGSLSIVNSLSGTADGIASRGAGQCLPTTPGESYGIAADLFIPTGQGSGPDGGSYSASVGVSIIFYDDSACEGHTLGNTTSGLLEDAGAWAHREGRGTAPAGAQSMAVRLVTLKNFRETQFEGRFDNVLVKVN